PYFSSKVVGLYFSWFLEIVGMEEKYYPLVKGVGGDSLSRLNFDYINLLSNKDIVIGLPKLKYVKDQLCSSCELSKAKRSSSKSKAVPCSKGRLNLLHMDLCDADVPSQQELDLLLGPLYDEFFNAGSNPSTNIQSTSAPSTHTNVHAEENNNDQAEERE
nr:retrovirus-related Pol polyprotein from transposon TNT 1-94 [Tanacetum cinerariifolium]